MTHLFHCCDGARRGPMLHFTALDSLLSFRLSHHTTHRLHSPHSYIQPCRASCNAQGIALKRQQHALKVQLLNCQTRPRKAEASWDRTALLNPRRPRAEGESKPAQSPLSHTHADAFPAAYRPTRAPFRTCCVKDWRSTIRAAIKSHAQLTSSVRHSRESALITRQRHAKPRVQLAQRTLGVWIRAPPVARMELGTLLWWMCESAGCADNDVAVHGLTSLHLSFDTALID